MEIVSCRVFYAMMMKRKILYVPGMISLLGLPFLMWISIPKKVSEKQVLTMSFPSDNPAPYNLRFSTQVFRQYVRTKKRLLIDFSVPDPEQDPDFFARELDFISGEVARLQFLPDTSGVLQIEFGENNVYGNFVWLINQAKLYKIGRYMFFDDCFYLFANPPVDRLTVQRVGPI